MRNRTAASFICILLALAPIAAQAAEPAYQLAVATDRPEALYSVGQKAKFLVTLRKDGQAAADAEVAWVLDKDGMPPVRQGKLRLENGTGAIAGTLAEPGFLICRVTYTVAEKQQVSALAGAGFDPLTIRPSLPPPDDFDAFWAAQKARLAAVPMKPALAAVTSPVQGVECFEVQVPCVPPRPVSGHFARPAGAARKSLPAILWVHAAGVYSSSLGNAAAQAKEYGALAMDFNAHGIANGQPAEFYKALGEGELAGYAHSDREDREKSYFLGMFLRLERAIQFITGQPEWNGKALVVWGSSQGGGQSVVAAGLDPRVTLISAGVPAMCDHSGKVVGRANGWPRLVPDADGKPDPKALQAARYFDAMSFAARAKAEAIFSVGFVDGTCPPTSVYAAYNAWPGRKQIVNEPLMGHEVSRKLMQIMAAAIKEHIAARK